MFAVYIILLATAIHIIIMVVVMVELLKDDTHTHFHVLPEGLFSNLLTTNARFGG